MIRASKRQSVLVLRLILGLALLGYPNIGSAAGAWSVIAAPPKPGGVASPTALALDTAGKLYLADLADDGNGRIQKRDALGNWSMAATAGDALGQVHSPVALAADLVGNPYVADMAGLGRIQERTAQGNWLGLAAAGKDLGLVSNPIALAVDAGGNLYVAERRPDPFGCCDRIQQRDAQGRWSVIAAVGDGPGQVFFPTALAVDAAGNLYVADATSAFSGRIQKRDAQGIWSTLATTGSAPGQVDNPCALAVDMAGNLYAADMAGFGRIQQRDAQGIWSVIATQGSGPGQIYGTTALAVDGAGRLYVADTGNDRVQEYTP